MLGSPTVRLLKKRRSVVVVFVFVAVVLYQALSALPSSTPDSPSAVTVQDVLSDSDQPLENAVGALNALEVKGRAPKTGYARTEFSDGWAQTSLCDVRNLVLKRDMQVVMQAEDGCTVLSGTLIDPYTGTQITFQRGEDTSSLIQIDHVVALSDAWQKGAQALSVDERFQFHNDTLNLLAVDGPTNQKKGDSDAASWLPPNRDYRCRYVARQIAVKKKYRLWVTEAEKSAMVRVLDGCVGQSMPI